MERDENTMKNKNQLITSGFVLMMTCALLFSSVAVIAGSGVGSGLGSSTGPEPVVTITAPAIGSFNTTGSVMVKWTVAANQTSQLSHIWNHTRLTNITTSWQEPAWHNDSKLSSRTFSGLSTGNYKVEVKAVYWNASAGKYQNSTTKNVTFHRGHA